jgi:signal peptidase II
LTGKYRVLFFITLVTVIVDQATKHAILATLPLYESVEIVPGFFSLTHIHNPGGAFGFMAGQPQGVRTVLFLVVSTLAAGFVLYLYRITPRTYPWLLAALAMIFGGAVGNLVDRIRFGVVVDFLDVYVKNIHWPAFNVADSAITVGMTVLVFHILFKKVPL